MNERPQPDACSKCTAKERTKRHHLEKFQKLCITLHYGQHLVIKPSVKRNIQEALEACNWIYAEESERNVAQPG
ncbi:MAG: hypothetical protein VXZ72_04675 [Chlamydiota bacterium]|nr:hypothetical protein [Chlamydiota bacterium]